MGIVSIAGLCGDIASQHPFIALVRSTMVVTYLGTLYKDSEYWRMLFFYAFIFNAIAQPSLVVMGAEGFEINATKAAERECENMKQEEMKSYGYKNEEECVEGYYNMIWWVLLALSPIYLLL